MMTPKNPVELQQVIDVSTKLTRRVSPFAGATMEASDGILTVNAYSDNARLTSTLICEGDLERTSVDTATLNDVLKRSGITSFTRKNNELILKGENVKAKLGIRTWEPSEFNHLENGTIVPLLDFQNALSVTTPPTQTPGIHGVFNGVHIGNKVVGTDGWRLHAVNINLGFEALVEPIGITEALKLMSNEVTVATDNRSITITGDDVTFSSRLLDGNYPDYERILPTEQPETYFTASKKDVLEALATIAVVSDNRARITLTRGELEITGEGSLGEATSIVELSDKSGDEGHSMLLNAKYFQQGLQALGDEVRFELFDTKRQLIMRSGDVFALVVPLREL